MADSMPETLRLAPEVPANREEAGALSDNAGLLWDFNSWRKCRYCGVQLDAGRKLDYCEDCTPV